MSDGSRDGAKEPNLSGKDSGPSRGPRFPRNLVFFMIMALAIVTIASVVTYSGRNTKKLSFHEFRAKYWDEEKKAYHGLLEAKLSDEMLSIKPAAENPESEADAKRESEGAETAPPLLDLFRRSELWYNIDIPPQAIDYRMLLDLQSIPKFAYTSTNHLLMLFVYNLVAVLVIIALLYLLLIRPLRSQGGPGNVLSFGRSRPKVINKETTRIRFDDVAGIDEAKEDVAEVIEFLKSPEKFEKLGGRIPRGLLFVGPPGTGKTLLAKAIAGEAGVPFYSISGSDFVEMFVGVGASRVRDLFRQAKENTPCIIYLDEVDAVGRRRGSGLGGGHDEREQTLNAILVEMDGFDTNEQVIVIAATNRPDVLDPALLRPGRFDREIVIDLPDLKGRYEILKVHSRHVKIADSVDLMTIARGTPGFSGAELEAVINESAIRASMSGKSFIEQDDLEEARDKVRFGRAKRGRVIDEHDREVTAFHEAGHAIVSLFTPDVYPLHKVTIIPRGMSLGMTMYLPQKDRYNFTRRNMLGQIRVAFGGRIAEEMFCDDISAGASQDIDMATNIARKMVCDYGMSDLGPIRFANKEQQVFLGGEVSQPREFSEATAERIDHEVKKIIDESYEAARTVIDQHREEMVLLAKALLKHETLSAEEVDKILKEKNVDAITKIIPETKPTPDSASDPSIDSKPDSDTAADSSADGSTTETNGATHDDRAKQESTQ